MRNIIYVLALGVLLSNCERTLEVQKVDVLAEKELISTVLDSWHKSAAEANFKKYFDAMTTKSVFIGTDASENWNNTEFKEFSKPYFDKGKAWSFIPVERNIYINKSNEVAWFDELLETHMGICRGSGVLLKKEDTWKIEHYVLSLTIPNDNIEEIIKINKEKDSLFLKKLKK